MHCGNLRQVVRSSCVLREMTVYVMFVVVLRVRSTSARAGKGNNKVERWFSLHSSTTLQKVAFIYFKKEITLPSHAEQFFEFVISSLS